jgi:phenylacetic acid degradation operon negative regulatory protein
VSAASATTTKAAATRSLADPASRRYAGGAGSARGLLFTVLGEFVLPTGGSALTSAFIDVLGRLGVEEKACRQALMRTAADGWLTSQRRGRRTLWRLTRAAERFLTEGAERIYGFQAAQPEWDRRWLIVLARVPETERAARHLLRTRLTWAGLGSPSPGVWIGTHVDRLAEAERVLGEAGVRDGQTFLAEFARPPSADPLVRTVQLVHAWRRFPLIDPALPPELLPAGWSGVRAAKLFRRRRAQWHDAAQARWRRIADEPG